jgi:hypothetical protein
MAMTTEIFTRTGGDGLVEFANKINHESMVPRAEADLLRSGDNDPENGPSPSTTSSSLNISESICGLSSSPLNFFNSKKTKWEKNNNNIRRTIS